MDVESITSEVANEEDFNDEDMKAPDHPMDDEDMEVPVDERKRYAPPPVNQSHSMYSTRTCLTVCAPPIFESCS